MPVSHLFPALLTVNGSVAIDLARATHIGRVLKITQCSLSEKVFVSQDRVSGFPEKGADLRGSPGKFREV